MKFSSKLATERYQATARDKLGVVLFHNSRTVTAIVTHNFHLSLFSNTLGYCHFLFKQ